MNNHAVLISNVSKKFIVHYDKPTLVGKIFLKSGREEFWALKDINLKILKGERVGIIGSNGSGKTTLLEVIAGINSPTLGDISVDGKLVSLINLNAGFHPELSGIENIFLSGLLLGMVHEEINSKLESIVQFADVGDFINAPLYTFSEGMRLRLGFSVAVHTAPDIFLLDEGISVGDEAFIKKAKAKVKEILGDKKTLVVASHSMDFIKEHCDRVIWLSHGKIYKQGKTKVMVKAYLAHFKNRRNLHSAVTA